MYPSLHWDIQTKASNIYLTFDDGPTPGVTDIVLDKLKAAGAKATFFCLGKNIVENPSLYKRIIKEGHKIGNHTFSHVNGWGTTTKAYLEDVRSFEELHSTNLFRPPYGRIKSSQINSIKQKYKIVMWSILTRDYDDLISKEDCLGITMKRLKPGAILVFHDSLKAKERMLFVLDHVLEAVKNNNWRCAIID